MPVNHWQFVQETMTARNTHDAIVDRTIQNLSVSSVLSVGLEERAVEFDLPNSYGYHLAGCCHDSLATDQKFPHLKLWCRNYGDPSCNSNHPASQRTLEICDHCLQQRYVISSEPPSYKGGSTINKNENKDKKSQHLNSTPMCS